MPKKKIDFTYIQTDAELAAACAQLTPATRLALDTEFVGEKYYFPKLEILQLGDGERILLIDYPAIRDKKPLAKLLGNKDVLKILHAGGQDVQILHRELGKKLHPVFDTQIAASLLGFGAQASLGSLVQDLLGHRMSSKQSTSDWSGRPLSEAQLHYAAADVLYLHELHTGLVDKLVSKGRLAWYEDEQEDWLQRMFAEEEDEPGDLYRRVKDWMSLESSELAVLRELAIWRENTALAKNQPRRMIFRDEGLIELARFQPDTRDSVKKLRRLNVGQALRFYDELRACIDKGLNTPEDQWPVKPRPERPDVPTGLLEICQALVRYEADRHDIAPSVLGTTSDIQTLVVQRTRLDKATSPLLHGWRREVVGERLIRLLDGTLVVRVGKGGKLLFEDASR